MKKISHEMNLKKWTGIIEECRNSRQTAVKRCDENNVNIKTYYKVSKLKLESKVNQKPS